MYYGCDNSFRFHNVWEFWYVWLFNLKSFTEFLHRAYNIVFGLFQAPYYAFSQTIMAELTPPGFDNMVITYFI